MNVIWLLSLLLLGPFLLLLAFLALTSCLGDSFRARIAGFSINPRDAIYDRSYLRTMTNSGSAMSEQIELEDMLRDRTDGYDSDA
ncbi:hypothetical protein GX51_02878 [Blastomyces parvus]|uniref:Uncharacterized protein n=1 Tax=Blastomyces parvus TaxID=2060905 RepID=A0A2B7X9G0_9EURO|nr:hypothetical protein GX51_02878 [Blastomyces parvus]